MINKKNKLSEYILEVIKTIEEENTSRNNWKSHSKYISMRKLQIDYRGKVGEIFLKNTFKKLGKRVEYYDGKQGPWDLKIDNFKCEVKTATLDSKGKFQHEGVKNYNDFDLIIFLDIAPDDLYVTIYKKDAIPWKKLHLRGKKTEATGSGYKWDFKVKELENSKVSTLEDLDKIWNNAII